MKCQRCEFISHDYLHVCNKCGASLEVTRRKLGITEEAPEISSWDELFGVRARHDSIEIPEQEPRPKPQQDSQVEVVLDNFTLDDDDDFEFDLDN